MGGRYQRLPTEEVARNHTMQDILANCEEHGKCRVWNGYSDKGAPLLAHNRLMYRVREVVAHLIWHPKAGRKGKWGVRCETPGCVAEDHLIFRTPAEHAAHASRASGKAGGKLRNLPMPKRAPKTRKGEPRVRLPMEEVARAYTKRAILANCDQEGECQIWQGYLNHRGIPELNHGGKMYAVRSVLAHLTRHPKAGVKGVWGTSCTTPGCVAHSHLEFRTRGEHLKHRASLLPDAVHRMRNVAIAHALPRKVPVEDIPLIKVSAEPTRVLAARYGCSKDLIRKYRRNPHVCDVANPWAGLL